MNSVIRKYRENLNGFNITYKESDLFITADKSLKNRAFLSLIKYRKIIENHILERPEFFTSLKPLKFQKTGLEKILISMYEAGEIAEVGPFAAVAGAISEFVAKDLTKFCENILVENGGDVYITGNEDKIISIFQTKIKNIGLKISKSLLPIAVCSSSSVIGHSLSFGKAELAVVLSKSGAIADAFATRICNELKEYNDMEKVISLFKREKRIKGCVIFLYNKIGGWGDFEIINIK